MVGPRLREIRERLGLTLRDVEVQSRRIAELRKNLEYRITTGRLSHLENSNSLPSLYKLATLSEIYKTPYPDLLEIYGVETGVGPKAKGEGSSEVESPSEAKFAGKGKTPAD